MKYITTVNEQEFVIEIDHDDEIVVNGEKYPIDFQQLPDGSVVSLLINNRSLEAVVESSSNESWNVLILGELYAAHVQDERAYSLAKARGAGADVTGEVNIESPMPGIIIAVPVSAGDKVQKGDKVAILESMKMENELRTPRDGIVARVNVKQGDSVEKSQVLVVIGDE